MTSALYLKTIHPIIQLSVNVNVKKNSMHHLPAATCSTVLSGKFMAGGTCAAREVSSPRTPVDRGHARESLARDIACLAASFHNAGACIARLKRVLEVAAMGGGNDGLRQ